MHMYALMFSSIGSKPSVFQALTRRSDFHCGDAQDPSTRSGLVALKPEKIVRPGTCHTST